MVLQIYKNINIDVKISIFLREGSETVNSVVGGWVGGRYEIPSLVVSRRARTVHQPRGTGLVLDGCCGPLAHASTRNTAFLHNLQHGTGNIPSPAGLGKAMMGVS